VCQTGCRSRWERAKCLPVVAIHGVGIQLKPLGVRRYLPPSLPTTYARMGALARHPNIYLVLVRAVRIMPSAY